MPKREKKEPVTWEVLVGNLGSVYHGPLFKQALKDYAWYKGLSKAGYGRVAHEPVTLFKDGEIHWEYNPPGSDHD